MNDFKNFKSSPHVPNYPEGETNVLPAGNYDLKVSDVYITSDHFSSLKNPVKKTNLPEWKDATPQLAVVFWHKDGVTVRRFNGHGFMRYTDMSAKQQKDYDELGTEGYAVHKTKKTRVISKPNTESCENILNQFFDACNLPEGSTYLDLPDCMVQGTIVDKEFGDKIYHELTTFKRVGSEVVIDEKATADEY